MPFLSDSSHLKFYEEPSDQAKRISDVEQEMGAVLKLDVNLRLKKLLIKELVWEVTNIRGDFKGRYRSEGVMTQGMPIQRDHVWQKSKIIDRILKQKESLSNILSDIVHCVVTKAEHDRLTILSKSNSEIDGWSRYKAANIIVLDMVTNEHHVL